MTRRVRRLCALSLGCVLVSLLLPAGAQQHDPMGPAEQLPPPPPPPRQEATPAEDELPWGLPEELLKELQRQTEIYADYAIRFTCNETARQASYDSYGRASQDKLRRYAYLLERDEDGVTLREYRQRLAKSGQPKKGRVDDEERFPPAYAWVFLFSDFNQGFFGYRDLGDRFEGFDWVREIQFQGALGFTDGEDIRQWEGTVLVDAVTYTPLEIRAKPTRQDERILAMYRRWVQSFKLIGFRMGPKPLGYGCRVQFRLRRDGLTFPTELRYDTFRSIGPKRTTPVRASSRSYGDYRFFKTRTQQEIGEPASN